MNLPLTNRDFASTATLDILVKFLKVVDPVVRDAYRSDFSSFLRFN
jgi:hypothetical protein